MQDLSRLSSDVSKTIYTGIPAWASNGAQKMKYAIIYEICLYFTLLFCIANYVSSF